MEYTTLAAVDLGSNSFHLAIGRVVDEQLYPLDSLKETVRLGAGLGEDKRLDGESQERALAALKGFSERIRGMPREAVRVVGTNTLRVAKNAPDFLARAEATLGFPIEIISGREEARLIYQGVVHSMPLSSHNRLVVDVGGGSTEFIIGVKARPKLMDSLYMGCVSYTRRFFANGHIDKKSLKQAELAARQEVQTIAARYQKTGWKEAVCSSGTARSIAEVIQAGGLSEQGITAKGLDWLREELLRAGELKKLALAGLREERIPVFAGGTAIMSAVFHELELKEMAVAEGALRQGVLWDLLGRVHHRDIRELTVEQFVKRYHVDLVQAERVSALARNLFRQLAPGKDEGTFQLSRFLEWGAKLHEVGISISPGAFHKHSAYILTWADMPGFSRLEQNRLANLVLAQRGKLSKMDLAIGSDPDLATLVFCLRLAVIVYRSRRTLKVPGLKVELRPRGYRISLDRHWLEDNHLVATALESEAELWKSVGMQLEIAAY
jgi:exopolyphosphatase/guanosine-5'-triphosphate,3'-diphosphate pyrophosphatase